MIYPFALEPGALLLSIVISAIDLYLFAASLRLILSQLSSTRTSTACRALRELVDPIPNHTSTWLEARRRKPSPPWVAWTIVIGAGLVARHLLTLFVVSMCRTQT